MISLIRFTTMRGRALIIMSAFLISLVTGCATVEGAGEDIQSAGEAVEDAAQDASN